MGLSDLVDPEAEAELRPPHTAVDGVLRGPQAQGCRRPVAQLRRGLRADSQPLVGRIVGARTVGVHSRHREIDVLHLTPGGHGGDLDQGVQGNLDVRQLAQRFILKVSQDGSKDGLVGDQNYVLLSKIRYISCRALLPWLTSPAP